MRCWAEILLRYFFFPSPGPKLACPNVLVEVFPLMSMTWNHADIKGPSCSVHFSTVQLLSHAQLFSAPWTAVLQASLSITSSWSLLKLKSIESVMPSNPLILCYLLILLPSILPGIRVFSNESAVHISDQSIGVSASASVLSVDIQYWFALGLLGWIFLQSKGLSRVFFNTTVQKHQFFSTQPFFIDHLSHPYMTTGKP